MSRTIKMDAAGLAAAKLKAEPQPEVKEVTRPLTPNKAFGLVEVHGRWYVTMVPYNALTQETGIPELLTACETYMDAEERLKITLAEQLFR